MTNIFSQMHISSKKLKSGNYQVKFDTGTLYGYLLAEPQNTVEEILAKIQRHLKAMENPERYLQKNLYSLSNKNLQRGRIVLFRNNLPESERKSI